MRRNKAARWLALGLALGLGPLGLRAASPERASAKISVDGAGFLRDREFRAALQRLLSSEQKTSLDANALEDAAVILSSALGEEGFQQPVIEIEATLTDGSRKTFLFDPTFAQPLPRPLQVQEARFKLKPGVRSYIAKVEFTGLTAVPLKSARSFFRSDATLLATARTNAYSPSRVARATDALLDELKQRGYAEAEVRAARIENQQGPIEVDVTVREGPQWEVASVRYRRDEGDSTKLPPPEGWVGRPWSTGLLEDIREAVRQAYYAEGFPDVGVHVEAESESAAAGRKQASIVATAVPGKRVQVGQVRFEGNVTTRESVLRRRVPSAAGEPLNVVAFERARYRIARLGVFEGVDLKYEPEDGAVRNPVFTVREGARYETHLLLGYGSYEQVRGGVEHRQMNIFGLAHQSRLELVHSLKSTSGEYTYTVPEIFGESIDGTVRLFGLRRKEIAFLRQEYGVNVSLKRRLRQTGGEATAGYTFQSLRAPDSALSTRATDQTAVRVASMNFGLTGDRRDNPLRPRHGYHWSIQLESADPTMGGEVTYQRSEVSAAYHTRWGEGRWVHAGLSQGMIFTIGSDDRSLPVNKRFFPGGDNGIRGYQRGEAAPRGPDGLFVGAKAYVLLNLELEQALTPNWSMVAFLDAAGTAVSLRDLPASERLYSAGLGIRYQTLIGPIRLEYGRNLNRRPGDPSGTWHVSLGYPF